MHLALESTLLLLAQHGSWPLLLGMYARRRSNVVYFQLPSALGTQESCPVSGIEVHWVEDPVYEDRFFFQPPVQALPALRFSLPSGTELSRAFSHLALVGSFLLPPKGSDPQSHFKQELVLPSHGNQFSHFYRAAVNWWEKAALSS